MNTASQNPTSFSQSQADALARLLNLVFSSAVGYGPVHPTTQRNYDDFVHALAGVLENRKRITLIRNRESLYFEEFNVDARINVRRFVALFKRVDLHSVSFEQDVSVADVRALVDMFTDPSRFETVLAMQEELAQRQCQKVRLNYVIYTKLTADEKVVDHNTVVKQFDLESEPATQELVVEKLGGLISLKSLLENPRFLAVNIIDATRNVPGDMRGLVIQYLQRLNGQIQEQSVGQRTISPTELMESVYKLKIAMREGLAVQQQMGRLMREEGALLSEVDELTYRTIVNLVRNEYRNGAIAVKRLAHVISRLVPDIKDLKRLLPLLKEGLIAEGMRLSEFLGLVQELNRELRSDALMEILEEGAGDIGLSADDLVEAIRDNPGESARLLMLAAEVRKGTGSDDSKLTAMLTDYVESISSRMSLKSQETAGNLGGKALKSVVYRLEKQLLTKLKEQGIGGPVLEKVEKQLAGRFQRTLAQLKNDWMVAAMARGGEVSVTYLMQILDSIVDQEVDLSSIRDSLRESLAARGFSPGRIQEIYDRIARRIRENAGNTPLPKGVLSTHNTLFFLRRQVKENLRYRNPFSVIALSAVAVRAAEGWIPLQPGQRTAAEHSLFEASLSMLRDIDIVGSLGTVAGHIPFIILPMTTAAGAKFVISRMRSCFDKTVVALGDEQLPVRVVISTIEFDQAVTPGVKEFLGLVKMQQAKTEAAALDSH